MTELLERWVRVEPARCQLSSEGRVKAWTIHTTYYRDDGSAVGTFGTFVEIPPTGIPRMGDDRGVLLLSIIEAIEARGWLWSLNNGYDPNLHTAHVDAADAASGSALNVAGAARALLTAYLNCVDDLAALEAA